MRTRIALKYGLLITLGVIAWVVVTHLLIPEPHSAVHSLGSGIFFNLLHIAGIYFALTTAKNEADGELIFKEGLKTGMATALVFALTSSLFFRSGYRCGGSEINGERTRRGESAAYAGRSRGFLRFVCRFIVLWPDLFNSHLFLPGKIDAADRRFQGTSITLPVFFLDSM